MAALHKLWMEKYRPQHIEDYIFQNDAQKIDFLKMIKNKSIPHLLLSGTQGSGKTTIAKILITECNIDTTDVMVINASDENSVDVIRDKIKNFITTFAMGDYKVVLLEEADYITASGQAVLRVMMEEYIDIARFILTCNYENKILPSVKSRCQHYRFKSSDKNDIAEYVVDILMQERIKFDLDLVDKYIDVGYPDVRKIVNLLQQNSHDGILNPPQSTAEVGDYKFTLLDLVERDQWQEARVLACSQVATEEWEDVYRFFYENLHKAPKFTDVPKWEEGMIIIAEHLYKHSICADAEINAAAMFIRLGQV
jgi:DNA polymerase III delta prime subunit